MPGDAHWIAALHVLSYAVSTAPLGIYYRVHRGPDSRPEIAMLALSDAALARCRDSRRSTGGYVIMVNGGAVAASSKKYAYVDLSSTSAELKALSLAAIAIVAMRHLLADIGMPLAAPTMLINDCRSALIVAENPGTLRTRMTHLSTGAFKVRETVREGMVTLLWAPTDKLASDVLTKNLGRAKFERFQRYILGLPDDVQVRNLITRVIRSWL